MNYQLLDKKNQTETAELFTTVFSNSEGDKEGKLIGKLASELTMSLDNQEIICVGAYENKTLRGAIFFTKLHFKNPFQVFMLAPVAVSTEHQGKGVGQALINYGLNELKNRSVDIAITYGDPAFYRKVGFLPLSEKIIQAPLTLSMPEGWLGQSLTDDPIPTITDRPKCVEAFNNPVYW